MADKRILIVDYDLRSAEVLAGLFEPHGIIVDTAADGLTAWEKYQLERPDLVILEAILPRLHGFDLTTRIVQDSKGTVPVVILTGLYKGPQYRHEALTSFGAAEYFEKPFDDGKLVRCVLDLLKEKVDIGLDLPTPDEIVDFLKKQPASRPPSV